MPRVALPSCARGCSLSSAAHPSKQARSLPRQQSSGLQHAPAGDREHPAWPVARQAARCPGPPPAESDDTPWSARPYERPRKRTARDWTIRHRLGLRCPAVRSFLALAVVLSACAAQTRRPRGPPREWHRALRAPRRPRPTPPSRRRASPTRGPPFARRPTRGAAPTGSSTCTRTSTRRRSTWPRPCASSTLPASAWP